MSGKLFASAVLLFAAGYALGSGSSSRGEPELPRLSTLVASNVTSGTWAHGADAPSGAIATHPEPAVCLNRTRGTEGEIVRTWYKLASLSDVSGATLRGVCILSRKQNSNAVAYLVTEDGRAVPVFAAEVLRK